MNKRGQTLILFIILIPIILMLLGLVVDIGLVISKKTQINDVCKTIIRDYSDASDDDILKVMGKNDIDTKNVEIIRNNGLEIKNIVKVKSIFGSIIGLKEYTIKIDVKESKG